MGDELRLVVAFLFATGAALAATPIAIALADRTGFHDHPVGYKGHAKPTPYLGGAAVVAAFLAAGLLFSDDLSRLSPIVVCAFALWCMGTYDDRVPLSPTFRLAVEFALAGALWASGLGWDVAGVPAIDLMLTCVWVVGLTNAFNLMDNMDGAAATVGTVTCLAAALLASTEGDTALAALSVGMAGACLGFLPYNLAGPARIFLGDGGSLPIGFVAAASIMAVPNSDGVGWTLPLAAVILAGLPVIDTALVMISRRRAGVPLLTGGRDHMTHRLATRLGSPVQVAAALATAQALLGVVAVGVVQLGEGLVVSAWALWFVAATAAVILLETRTWAPVRLVVPGSEDGERETSAPGTAPALSVAEQPPTKPPRNPTPVEIVAIGFIVGACGLSPAMFGFYSLSVWGPIALFMLAALLGLVIARPARPRPEALWAIGALVTLWAWALISTGWAESAGQALVEANRWLLYAAVVGVFVLLLRDDRLTTLLLACAGGAVALFGGYLAVRLVSDSGPDLFLQSRLNEPLGYINGQAGYLLLGIWPAVALAERARNHVLAGAAISVATLLAGLAVLGQARAIVPAAVVSILLVLLALPGRVTRIWALIAIGAGIGVALPSLLDVYDTAQAAKSDPSVDVLRDAIVALLIGAALAGIAFGGARWAVARVAQKTGTGALRNASITGFAAAALVALVVAGIAIGNPFHRLDDEWDQFRNLDTTSQGSDRSRFTSGGGNRYDYWRIAKNQFVDHKFKGIGAGNYDTTYFRERRTTEDIKQPHSIEFQTLAELGIVGGLALLAFLVAIGFAFARRARQAYEDPRALAIAVAGGGMFTVWLVHTSVDWLHLIPGVTGIALCGAAALLGPWRPPRTGGPASARSTTRIVVIVACALVALLGATLLGRATLADKYRDDAEDVVATDPREALDKTADSLDLNDEDLATYYVRAAAFARLDDYRRARATLVEATRREPSDFVPWALLGDLATRRGDTAAARRAYTRAHLLNPRLPELAPSSADDE